MNTCSIPVCHKTATLKRHMDALHAQQKTKFQYWSCEKIYDRKENVLRHARKTQRYTDGKFIITTLTNKHYKPEIFKPKTCVPPMEARSRNIIRLNISTPKKTSTGTYIREKTYLQAQTQTLNYPNGQHLRKHSYSTYTLPAAMNRA